MNALVEFGYLPRSDELSPAGALVPSLIYTPVALATPATMVRIASLCLAMALGMVWRPTTSRYYSGTAFRVSESHFQVPLDHANPERGNLDLYVRRFIGNAQPRRLLFLIPGGPGQSSRVYEGEVKLFEGIPNLAIYLLDHRGTGKSGKLARGKQNRCLLQPLQCVAEPARMIHFSVENATRDLISWTDHLASVYPQAEFYAAASSYGTHLLHRLLQARPHLLTAALLVDFYPSTRLQAADLSPSIIAACHRDPACAQQWPSVAHLHGIMRDVASLRRNQCTRYLNEAMREFGTSLTASTHFFLHNILLSLPPNGRHHPMAVALAFLGNLHGCPNLDSFKGQVGQLLDLFYRKGLLIRTTQTGRGRLSTASGALVPWTSRTPKMVNKAASNGHLNPLLNAYIGYSEAHGQDLGACQAESQSHPLSECSLVGMFLEGFRTAYHDLAYASRPVDISALSTSTTVFLVGGALDSQTPMALARKAFELIKAPQKTFFQLDHGLHASLAETACTSLVYAALFDPARVKPAQSCIDQVNRSSIDWQSYPGYLEGASLKIPVTKSTWPWLIAGIVLLLLMAAVGVAVYFYLRRK